jgi:hypothetical protein
MHEQTQTEHTKEKTFGEIFWLGFWLGFGIFIVELFLLGTAFGNIFNGGLHQITRMGNFMMFFGYIYSIIWTRFLWLARKRVSSEFWVWVGIGLATCSFWGPHIWPHFIGMFITPAMFSRY